jgi:hypothetical protein
VKNKETFRSPYAVAVWWLWALFAAGNLIDLAVQGRDHLSVVAGAILLFVTGIVYVTALRPKMTADDDGIEIDNPLRTHRIGWAAVAAVDATELVRVRCEWPATQDSEHEPGDPDKQLIYSWAVRSPRRKRLSTQMRDQRRAASTARGIGGFAGGYASAGRAYPPPAPAIDTDRVVTALNARADQVRADTKDAKAQPPVSAWYWPGVAAVVVPALILLVAALI